MTCLRHSPTAINKALCVFSSIISQMLNESSQKKAGRAVHRFLVIHWFPSFHPQLLFYWTNLHMCGAAVRNTQCRRDPPAPHPPSMGEQWQHKLCPTNAPRASRWHTGVSEEHLSLPGVLWIPLQWTLQRASVPVITSLVTDLSILGARETRGLITSSDYLLQKQVKWENINFK